jgi:hypothetical protein
MVVGGGTNGWQDTTWLYKAVGGRTSWNFGRGWRWSKKLPSLVELRRFFRNRGTDVHGRGARSTEIDIDLLAEAIAQVEESLDLQGMELSCRGKAELVGQAFRAARDTGDPLDDLWIDRLVWMNATWGDLALPGDAHRGAS